MLLTSEAFQQPHAFYFIFWKGHSPNLEFFDLDRLVGQGSLWIHSSLPPQNGIRGVCHCTLCWGANLRPSELCTKHFTH